MLRRTGRKATPHGARVLPLKSYSGIELAGYPVDLTVRKPPGKRRPRAPCDVRVRSGALKEQIYEWKVADRRKPTGAAALHRTPDAGEGLGYTPEYFKEMANEVRVEKRNTKGERRVVWEPRTPSSALRVEAWDARVYALAALFVQSYPHPLDKHLLRLHRERETRLAAAGADNVVSMERDD